LTPNEEGEQKLTALRLSSESSQFEKLFVVVVVV